MLTESPSTLKGSIMVSIPLFSGLHADSWRELEAAANLGLNLHLDAAYGKSAEERAAAFDERVESLCADILAEKESCRALFEDLINDDSFMECVNNIQFAARNGMLMSRDSAVAKLVSLFSEAAAAHAKWTLEHLA
jgi:hypothetical protein